ncbi:MAG: hypothetical protein M1820_001792 [Bogoriella megaspora]|nr:MAG: hypothetical protein M1820_001792 [Bogoriella megaspora]
MDSRKALKDWTDASDRWEEARLRMREAQEMMKQARAKMRQEIGIIQEMQHNMNFDEIQDESTDPEQNPDPDPESLSISESRVQESQPVTSPGIGYIDGHGPPRYNPEWANEQRSSPDLPNMTVVRPDNPGPNAFGATGEERRSEIPIRNLTSKKHTIEQGLVNSYTQAEIEGTKKKS